MLIADMLPLSARVDDIIAVTHSELVNSDLKHIHVPELIISAEDDLYHALPGAGLTAEHIPDAELKVFKIGGHRLISHGAEVQTNIAEFLGERVSYAAPISDGQVSRNLSEAVVAHCMPPLNYGVRRLAKASRLVVSN